MVNVMYNYFTTNFTGLEVNRIGATAADDQPPGRLDVFEGYKMRKIFNYLQLKLDSSADF